MTSDKTNAVMRPLPTPPSSATSATFNSSQLRRSFRPLPVLPPQSARGSLESTRQPSFRCSLQDVADAPTDSYCAARRTEAPLLPASRRPDLRIFIELNHESSRTSFPLKQQPRTIPAPLVLNKPASRPIAEKFPQTRPPLKLPSPFKPRLSLDSLAVRSPSLSPLEQVLSPVVSRRLRKANQPNASLMMLSTTTRDANAMPLHGSSTVPQPQEEDDDANAIIFVRSPSKHNFLESPQYLFLKTEASASDKPRTTGSKCSDVKSHSDGQRMKIYQNSPWHTASTPCLLDNNSEIEILQVMKGEDDDSSSDSDDEYSEVKHGELDHIHLPIHVEYCHPGPKGGGSLFRHLRGTGKGFPLLRSIVGELTGRQKPMRLKRASKMWLKEKDGQGWEETDFDTVLNELRKLR